MADLLDQGQEPITNIPQLHYLVYETAFSQIKLFLDEFLNKIWFARVTILNPMGRLNFSCKTCDSELERSGFARKSI